MTLPLLRPAVLAAQLGAPVESWTDLDAAVLLKTRRRKDCMTCHWFRHHAGVSGIAVLTHQLRQG